MSRYELAVSKYFNEKFARGRSLESIVSELYLYASEGWSFACACKKAGIAQHHIYYACKVYPEISAVRDICNKNAEDRKRFKGVYDAKNV